MSTASRSLIAGMLLGLGLAGATAALASPPRAVAARPVAARPLQVRPAAPRPTRAPEISAGEAARIRYQVHQHHQMQRRANADGEISPQEQAALARDASQVRHLIQTARTN